MATVPSSPASQFLDPESLVRPEVLALRAYHVPPATGMIKLDAMENPYALPQSLRTAIAQRVAQAEVNRYPDAGADALKQRIRAVCDLPPGAGIVLGNGSDEIIQLLALALAKPGATLLSVEPSFVMYRMIAAFTGMKYVGVPLAPDFSLDCDALVQSIEREQPALVFLAYPNNPTGNLFDKNQVERVIRAAPGLVVIDEAYYAFASDSFLPRLLYYPNVLVMRTFSKLGMAGLRLGFLAGPEIWVAQLEKLRLPYNVGVLPQCVAEILLDHHDVLLAQAQQIKEERSRLLEQLGNMAGVNAYPSAANFILFRVKDADKTFEGLKQRNILIKKLHGSHPALTDCLRVTVGSREENEQFLTALQEVLLHD